VFCYVLPNWQNKGNEKDNDNGMTHTEMHADDTCSSSCTAYTA